MNKFAAVDEGEWPLDLNVFLHHSRPSQECLTPFMLAREQIGAQFA